jgi:hypothetical protein
LYYPGAYTKAVLSPVGVFVFFVVVRFTPAGKGIERPAEALLHQ